jgi:DnaJ-class molecular chaperone
MPREDGGRGDLYAILEIAVPDQVGPEEKKLWEKLAEESRWRPGGRS